MLLVRGLARTAVAELYPTAPHISDTLRACDSACMSSGLINRAARTGA